MSTYGEYNQHDFPHFHATLNFALSLTLTFVAFHAIRETGNRRDSK